MIMKKKKLKKLKLSKKTIGKLNGNSIKGGTASITCTFGVICISIEYCLDQFTKGDAISQL